ncbi:hypothetical protein ACVWYG_003597 [Pedobacter sp. UYEF25]
MTSIVNSYGDYENLFTLFNAIYPLSDGLKAEIIKKVKL